MTISCVEKYIFDTIFNFFFFFAKVYNYTVAVHSSRPSARFRLLKWSEAVRIKGREWRIAWVRLRVIEI